MLITRPMDDAITFWGMLLIAAVVVASWVLTVGKNNQRHARMVLIFTLCIAAINYAVDQTDWFARLDIFPPPFVVLNIVILLSIVFLGYGGSWRRGGGVFSKSALEKMSTKQLIALQIFRLPLEILMLRAATLQIMPVEFSMQGFNFDVLTGLGALLLMLYASSQSPLVRFFVWAWNVMGIFLLLVIIVLAVLTSPIVHWFGVDALHINSWVLYFPYSLLPTLLVSFALLGHLVLTRKLLHHGKIVL